MRSEDVLRAIAFFNSLNIVEQNVTTEDEKNLDQLVVLVTYEFEGQKFTSQRLYYKDITVANKVANVNDVISYFGGPVFWLDIDEHDWPDTKGNLSAIIIPEIAGVNNPNFVQFLNRLANDSQDGAIQEITSEGQPVRYFFNLVNNNHWHDVILLIKEIIRARGGPIDKRFFSRLVFRWDNNDPRARVSLYPDYKMITDLRKNIQSVQQILMKNEIIQLLKDKPQIILQGPPGTGKTRLAKMIAKDLAMPITIEEIKSRVHTGLKISSISNWAKYTIEALDEIGVTVLASTGKPYKPKYEEIVDAYVKKIWLTGDVEKGNDSYSAAIGKYLFEDLATCQYVKLIQFHPAYSYEDFVRGISAKPNGGHIEYKTENRLFADFAKEALKNYENSEGDLKTISKENWIAERMEDFKDKIQDELDERGKYALTKSAHIYELDETAFRYSGENWHTNFRMPFSDLIKLYFLNITERKQINQQNEVKGRVKQHATYFFNLLDKFREFLKDKPYVESIEKKVEKKNFVLIIDEINRANLPAVLGELIYALEYRGQALESMYELEDEGRKIILPPNLFIIGTMNTADRSVGHIDYAIRRRFAFVDLLPELDPVHPLVQDIFKKVSELFIESYDKFAIDQKVIRAKETLSPDFRPEDVWIGHSYFICKKDNSDENMENDKAKPILANRLKYEVLPILKEYIKDGILVEGEANETENKIQMVLQSLSKWQ